MKRYHPAIIYGSITLFCLLFDVTAYLLGQPAQSIFAFAWLACVLGNVSFAIIFHLKEQRYRRMLVGAVAFRTVPAAFGCFSLCPYLSQP